MIPNIGIHIHTMYLNNTHSLQLVGWTHAILLQSVQVVSIEIKADERVTAAPKQFVTTPAPLSLDLGGGYL
jgi:hypothetical protein